jgi:hypothetical protein
MTDEEVWRAIERLADATELQNALLLEVIHQQHRARAAQHPDPDETGPSHHAIATDVVDSYGDLYGGQFGGWEFDPVTEQVHKMGDRR